MNRLVDDLYDATAHLAGAPAVSTHDIQAKLAILSARLRESLHPEHRGEVLTYLLADSVRKDCRVLFCGTALRRARRGL